MTKYQALHSHDIQLCIHVCHKQTDIYIFHQANMILFIAINGHGATIHFKWILCSNEQSKLCFCPTESILSDKNRLALPRGRRIFLQSRKI